MDLGNISQFILYVENMEQMVEFYRDTLGLEVKHPSQDGYEKVVWVTFSTGPCTLALHSGGERRLGKDSPKFTFTVSDVEGTVRMMQDAGVVTGNIVEAYPGSFVCDAKDPEGNIFFVQSHPANH